MFCYTIITSFVNTIFMSHLNCEAVESQIFDCLHFDVFSDLNSFSSIPVVLQVDYNILMDAYIVMID